MTYLLLFYMAGFFITAYHKGDDAADLFINKCIERNRAPQHVVFFAAIVIFVLWYALVVFAVVTAFRKRMAAGLVLVVFVAITQTASAQDTLRYFRIDTSGVTTFIRKESIYTDTTGDWTKYSRTFGLALVAEPRIMVVKDPATGALTEQDTLLPAFVQVYKEMQEHFMGHHIYPFKTETKWIRAADNVTLDPRYIMLYKPLATD